MNRLFLRKIGVLIFVLIFSFGGCSKKSEDNSGGGGITVYQIEYKATGTASNVFVTYENEDGGTSQKEVSVPWLYSFSAGPGFFVYISAQNQGETGSVTVTIYKSGAVFKTSTSTGAYVIASASGSL